MGRTLQRRRKAPTFRFDFANIPEADWVSMTQGHKLPGVRPARHTLYTWTNIGVRLSWLPAGERLLLPSFTRNKKRYTTVAAYLWWMQQQQEPM